MLHDIVVLDAIGMLYSTEKFCIDRKNPLFYRITDWTQMIHAHVQDS